jgi:hypothetical protein
VISRDRAGTNAEGARDGAPEAVQVTDRSQLVDNLADALEDFCWSTGTALKAAEAAPPVRRVLPGEAAPSPTGALARPPVGRRDGRDDGPTTTRHALHANGAAIAQITRTVGISRMTVCKYLRDGPHRRKRHSVHGRQHILQPQKPPLLTRWEEGCRMATVRWREIRAQDFAHPLTNVQRFVAQLRQWVSRAA